MGPVPVCVEPSGQEKSGHLIREEGARCGGTAEVGAPARRRLGSGSRLGCSLTAVSCRGFRVSVDPEGHSGAWLCFCAFGLGQRRILFRCWWTGRGGEGESAGQAAEAGPLARCATGAQGDTGVACCEDREPCRVPRQWEVGTPCGAGDGVAMVGFCPQQCRIPVLAPQQADRGVSVGVALALPLTVMKGHRVREGRALT